MARVFNFWWDGVGYGGSDWFADLGTAHATFNQAFVQSFPQLMYTTPFTSYTPGGIGIGSRLSGLGETNYSDAQIRAWVLNAASVLDIVGDPSNLHVSSEEIGGVTSGIGGSMQIPGTTVNPLVTTDGANALLDLGGASSWYIYAAGAVILALVLTRR